jgi:hypothetical protein
MMHTGGKGVWGTFHIYEKQIKKQGIFRKRNRRTLRVEDKGDWGQLYIEDKGDWGQLYIEDKGD